MEVTKEEYEEGILKLGKLVFDFAKVYRVTYHDDGVTPESDTDHTVMVGIVACSLAEVLYKDLDLGKIARYALVHDMVEVYAGDTDTFGISSTSRREKEQREQRALHLVEDAFLPVYPWLPKEMVKYEAKDDKEARFVKTIDKLMPVITHCLNRGTYFKKKRIGEKVMVELYSDIFDTIQKTYGKEFPELLQIVKSLKEQARINTYD